MDEQWKSQRVGKGNPNPELHPENLKPFPKGVSGNPSGRPKRTTFRALLLEIADEEANLKNRQPGHGITKRELLLREVYDEAIRTKDVGLLRLLFAYHDGKPPDASPDDADGMMEAEKPRIIIPDADDRHAPDRPST